MSRTLPAAALVLALAVPVALWGQTTPKKLTKADVLKLIELQIDDAAIVARIEQGGGPDFAPDAATEKEFRTAGASEAVIAALRRKPDDAPADMPDDKEDRERLGVWARQVYSNDCPLASEVKVNGHLIDEFSSTAQRGGGKHFKMGWNTVTVRTRVRPEVTEENRLQIEIGPTRKDPESGKVVMDPVLWSFTNGTDWKHQGTTMRHRSGPDVKEVTLTFRVFFAGLKYVSGAVKAGDYVLEHQQTYIDTPQVTSTVFVNGTPLNTFLSPGGKAVVITPLLKKGKNEFRVFSSRVPNLLEGNTVSFHVAGPAEYNATAQKYELNHLLNFRTTEVWVQDKKSGQWRADGKPGLEQQDWVVPLQLEAEPRRK